MRLRKQLLFLSLVTLTLPWVGCQYIREMDTTLRQGQTSSLAATAQAVIARVVSDPALSSSVAQYTPLHSPFYAHSLKEALWLDGYNDDWLDRGLIAPDISPNSDISANKDASNKPTLAIWQDQLHVFLKIKTTSLNYFNPAAANLDQSDHLLLFTSHGNYALFASAPGQFSVIKYNDEKIVTTKTLEHRIKGHWLEWSEGYQLEISLPLAWTQNGIAFDTHEQQRRAEEQHQLTPTLQPIIIESSLLTDELSIFSSRQTRLHIVTRSGHVIASSGKLQKNTKIQQHGFLEWLYTLALGNRTFPELPSSHANGVMLANDVWQKFEQNESVKKWYQLKSHTIAQTILPIRKPANNNGKEGVTRQVIGAVIAEQSASSLSDATNNALSRLLAYSFLASTFAGICLVLYATWLSLRIRKLSEAAAGAVSENGKISYYPQSG